MTRERTDGEKLRKIAHLAQSVVTNTEHLIGRDVGKLSDSEWKLLITRNNCLQILDIVTTVNSDEQPTCDCKCGETENLTEFASGWLCPRSAREQLSEKE